MIRTLDARLLVKAAAEVGEGPAWHAETGILSWVDIPQGRVHLCSADGEERGIHQIGRMVGAALPGPSGFLLAEEHGFSILSEQGGLSPVLPMLEEQRDLRFNDAKADPAGRVFAGTMAFDKTPGAGTLYRLDPGPTATPVLNRLTVSNGLGWSPDSRILWFADSAEPVIAGFDYDLATGELGGRRKKIPLQETTGVPDGLCVDDEGAVWLALWDGAAVHRYTPDGWLDTIVRVPAPRVTSCAFGGADGSTLFITTARRGMSEDDLLRHPGAGGIFVVEPSVTGPAATPWQPLTGRNTRTANETRKREHP